MLFLIYFVTESQNKRTLISSQVSIYLVGSNSNQTQTVGSDLLIKPSISNAEEKYSVKSGEVTEVIESVKESNNLIAKAPEIIEEQQPRNQSTFQISKRGGAFSYGTYMGNSLKRDPPPIQSELAETSSKDILIKTSRNIDNLLFGNTNTNIIAENKVVNCCVISYDKSKISCSSREIEIRYEEGFQKITAQLMQAERREGDIVCQKTIIE